MALIVFSDIHVNKDQIRLIECLNFLDYIKKYGKENNIYNIAVLGDIFHTSNSIRNQAFVPIFMKFLELKDAGFKMYFIPGNHDVLNNDNDCLAETFRSFGTFIKKSETINIDGFDYDFLAYTEDPLDIPNKSRVLLTHLAVNGFYYNPKMQDTSSIFTEETFDQYNLVVSGHLHMKQEKGNLCFVGSPYSTRRDEAGNHYFAVLKNDNYELIQYKDAPEYLTVDADDFSRTDIDYKNKLVTVRIGTKIENFVKMRDVLISHGAVSVDPEFIRNVDEVSEGEHKIDINEGVIKSVARYLSEVKEKNIQNDRLLLLFKNVLKRVDI